MSMVEALRAVSNEAHNGELKLFVEVELIGLLLLYKSEIHRYVGRLLVKSAGFASDVEIELFEIEDGDIVCFQKWIPDECKEQTRLPDVQFIFGVGEKNGLESVKDREVQLSLLEVVTSRIVQATKRSLL